MENVVVPLHGAVPPLSTHIMHIDIISLASLEPRLSKESLGSRL